MSATATRTARVPTVNGSRYLQQLAKHWSHRFEIVFDAAHAEIPFGGGASATLDAEADALVATVRAPDDAAAERMAGVVAEHLDRFAFREGPLAFDWR